MSKLFLQTNRSRAVISAREFIWAVALQSCRDDRDVLFHFSTPTQICSSMTKSIRVRAMSVLGEQQTLAIKRTAAAEIRRLMWSQLISREMIIKEIEVVAAAAAAAMEIIAAETETQTETINEEEIIWMASQTVANQRSISWWRKFVKRSKTQRHSGQICRMLHATMKT